MLLRVFRGLLLLLPGAVLSFGQTTDLKRDATFKEVRRVFINQTVIVRGAVGTSRYQGEVLLEWTLVKKTDAGFAADSKQIPATYKGKTASVVSVELLRGIMNSTETKNALGEPISQEDTPNPYFEIVVQFDDGVIALTRTSPVSIGLSLELASTVNALAQQLDKDLPSVIGKQLYAVGYSTLYRTDTSLQEIIGFEHKGILKQLSSTEIPLLEPLAIVAAKYITADDVIVLKVKLPSGTEALSVTRGPDFRDMSPQNKSLLARISGTLIDHISQQLTAKEIDAIKKRTIFRGMSDRALVEAVGFADKENEIGGGNKQIVFYDGRLLVYEDRDGKVTDWQSVDK